MSAEAGCIHYVNTHKLRLSFSLFLANMYKKSSIIDN